MIAICIAQSFQSPQKPVTHCFILLFRGSNKDREKRKRDGRCRGSKDIEEEGRKASFDRLWSFVTALWVIVTSLIRFATWSEWFSIHSISHWAFDHPSVVVSCSGSLFLFPADLISLTARSTSRHLRNLSTASPRSCPTVSGEWNNPVLNATAEVGLKDDNLNFFLSICKELGPLCGAESRGRTMIGMYDSRDSMMETSRWVGTEIKQIQSKGINMTNMTYQMEGEIWERYREAKMEMRVSWL